VPSAPPATRRNHALWLGPLLAVAGVLTYFTVFVRWPPVRDVPWVNLPLVALGIAVSVRGLGRAWARRGWRRASGLAGVTVSSALGVLLTWYCFAFSYRLPAAALALDVGAPVPAVTLTDHIGRPVDLARAATRPLVLVFYRGFW
jgi:hypothetical protein